MKRHVEYQRVQGGGGNLVLVTEIPGPYSYSDAIREVKLLASLSTDEEQAILDAPLLPPVLEPEPEPVPDPEPVEPVTPVIPEPAPVVDPPPPPPPPPEGTGT